MAPNHQDERSRHLCMDGPRSHPRIHVFQRQRCVEVRPLGSLSLGLRSVWSLVYLRNGEMRLHRIPGTPQVHLRNFSRAIYTNSHTADNTVVHNAVVSTESMQDLLCWRDCTLGKTRGIQGRVCYHPDTPIAWREQEITPGDLP